MNRYLFAVLVVLGAVLPGASLVAQTTPQVDSGEVLRMGDTVQRCGRGFNGDAALAAFAQAAALPPDDNHKWFVSVLTTRGCAPCAQLKKQWTGAAERAAAGAELQAGDRYLLALANPLDGAASWSHFNFYDMDDPAQQRRFAHIQVTAFPTIVVQPPLNEKYGPPHTVVYQGVYRGDPEQLARAVSEWMKRYIAKLPVRNGFGQVIEDEAFRQPDRPLPWSPTPVVEPVTPVTPADPATPLFPVLPFDVTPADPAKPADPANPNATDEIVVVTDGEANYDLLGDRRIHRAVEALRAQGREPRVRFVDLRDARDRLKIPVDKDDLPAIVHTRDGRVVSKLSEGMMDVFAGLVDRLVDRTFAALAGLLQLVKLAVTVFLLCGVAYLGSRLYRLVKPAAAAAPQADNFSRLEAVLRMIKEIDERVKNTPPASPKEDPTKAPQG